MKKLVIISILLLILNTILFIKNSYSFYIYIDFPVIPTGLYNIEDKLPKINGGQAFGLRNPSSGTIVLNNFIDRNLKNLLTEIILILPTFIAICVMVYGGVMMVIKAGDESQKKKSIELIQYSVIGITLIIFSYVIVKFVASIV